LKNPVANKQQRQFWVILTIVFLGFTGISIPYLIFPPLFLHPACSFLPASWSESSRAIFLGITLAAYPLGQFIGFPILGALSDEYGRKRLLFWTLLTTAVCNLFTGFAIRSHHLGLLVISRFIAGVMEGNIAIARAMAADIKTIAKHKTFGNINAAGSIAYIIGPFLGGLLTDQNLLEGLTASTPFFLIFLLFLFLAGLCICMLEKEEGKTASITVKSLLEKMQLMKRIARLCANKRLRFFLIVSTCFTLATDIFYEFGPVYLTVKWMFGPAQLIFYNGALCLGLAIGNGFLPTFISARISDKLSIIGAASGFALFLIGMAFVSSKLWMMALFGFSGLVIGVISTLITVKISDSVSDAIQGEVLGTQMSLRVLGDGIICLLGGVLLMLSSKVILLVAAALAILAALYYGVLSGKRGSLLG
jgi:MFS transporter, DHA1 family, tetracycline resistance protein